MSPSTLVSDTEMAHFASPSPRRPHLPGLLWADKFATLSAIFLVLVLFCALFGPTLLGHEATAMNLRMRNVPPSLSHGPLMLLGADSLGRSILARIMVGSQNTILIAALAVAGSLTLGLLLGLVAGYSRGRTGDLILRGADVVMSFPSLLLALIVLYVLGPGISNVIFVLALTRVPLYLRTSRAEVLEVRERMFVRAALVMGSGPIRIVLAHILPTVIPTMLVLATLDFAAVMLSEASLSFLGLGIQPPAFSWGYMVAEGQGYLTTAWWLSFWPGLAITLTALALNLLSSWLRKVVDPSLRWRLKSKVR